jgi:hypothetical protein
MRSKLILAEVAALVAGATALWSQQATTGAIQGTLRDPEGRPMANIPVAVLIRPTAGAVTRPFSTRITTAANGSFQATGLRPGNYVVCPHPTGTDLIWPCSWDPIGPTAAVAAGQTTAVPAINLKRGVKFRVRINDPNGVRRQSEGRVAGAYLHLAVRSGRGFPVLIPKLAEDNVGQDHEVLIPPDTPVEFVALSRSYEIKDADGKQVDKANGHRQDVIAPGGRAPQQVVLKVTRRQ